MVALLLGEAATDRYAVEILSHAGIPFRVVQPQMLHPDRTPVCLMAGRKSLTAEARTRLNWFVQQGGCLITVGSTNGLDDLLGISLVGDLSEGWLQFSPLAVRPSLTIGEGLQSSLHVFGGSRIHARQEAVALGRIVDLNGDVLSDAVTVRKVGQGFAICIAADLMQSIVHIQQGIAVTQDGKPAPDGSAPIDDGILKAEDGHVLDWERDRVVLGHGARDTGQGKGREGWVFFGLPIADELRALLLQAIFFAAQQKNLPLPMLWYWQDGVPAVGLISHDTDGNDPDLGWELLRFVQSLGIATTWCVIYPGGYPQSLYRAILNAGCEIALHFDAFTGSPLTTWSKRNLWVQWQWLRDAAGVAAVSNKNHYTRWEGRLEFFRWCEELGIQAEQSKGPSKRGTVGFLFGGSHPWRPIDDERERPRFLSVTAINLFSQDMVSDDTPTEGFFHPAIVPVSVGKWLLEQTVRMGGVAHFLFHPAHIRRQGTKSALEQLVAFGHELGVRWQTSAQIVEWLNRRRRMHEHLRVVKEHGGWQLKATQPLHDAPLLFLLPPEKANRADRRIYGFPFAHHAMS
jgi:hypothetical protein